MALVQSLVTAIVRADGDALVLHVGERPYVIAPSGTIELSAHGMNLEAMSGMLGQLLPPESLKALKDFGAVEHELAPIPAMHGDRYTVVAARGGDDVWIELRRHRKPRSAPALEPVVALRPQEGVEPVAEPEPSAVPMAVIPVSAAEEDCDLPAEPLRPSPTLERGAEWSAPETSHPEVPAMANAAPMPAQTSAGSSQEKESSVVVDAAAPVAIDAIDPTPWPAAAVPRSDEDFPFRVERVEPGMTHQIDPIEAEPFADEAPEELGAAAERQVPRAAAGSAAPMPDAPADLDDGLPSAANLIEEESSAVVVPLTRTMRIETGPRGLSSRPGGGIERLLRLASSRGASALYLPSQARPYIRADGDIHVLEHEPVLTSTDVESAVMELIPESARDALRRGAPTEWVSDLEDIGRIRCTTYRDYRGPGALFQMISARAASAEQLGLSREIQALSTESEGLVVVAGPRASGKSTLIAAFADLVNRRRSDYVITLERQIRLVHDNRHSLISQREVRGSSEEIVAQARLALRENPDVLVIEDIRSPDVLQVALDAAGSGLLVFISITAASVTAAIERLLDLVPADRRRSVQALMSETLRGAVAQVLLRKSGGGRLAAREVLLATAAVSSLLSEGQTAQLPLAIDSGRKHGMVPLNDALVAFVQSGAVDVREAYRKAADRTGLLALLKREGIDTSFVERLA
jgi:twitching motility protein PilT